MEDPIVQALRAGTGGNPACPGLDQWIQVDHDPDLWHRILTHALSCPVCAEHVRLRKEAYGEAFQAGRPALILRVPAQWRKVASIAAGVLLAAGGGALWLAQHQNAPVPVTDVPLGSTASEGTRFHEGTLAQLLSPLTRLAEVKGGAGDRLHLRLDQGDVSVEVPAGSGAWRMDTPAGTVRVLGTRFTVGVVRFPFPQGVLSCAVVEVQEGKVSISNGSQEEAIRAGHRGILIEGHPPIGPVQLGTVSSTLWIEKIRDLVRQDRPGSDWRALFPFLNSRREAARELFRSLSGIEVPETRRMALRCLAAVAAEEEFQGMLRDLRRVEDASGAAEVEEWRRQAWPSAE